MNTQKKQDAEMKEGEKVIDEAISLIKKRTGFTIEKDRIFLKDISYMDSPRRLTVCCGYFYGSDIYISLSIFSYINRAYTVRMLAIHNPTLKRTRDTIEKYYATNVEEGRKDALFTVVHEVGHLIHGYYFGFKGKNIPKQERTRNYKTNNPKENFADAFAEYVLDLIPHDSARYKRMESLIRGCRQERGEQLSI